MLSSDCFFFFICIVFNGKNVFFVNKIFIVNNYLWFVIICVMYFSNVNLVVI